MDNNTLYNKSIQLLQEVKLTQGPTGVSSTLRRHGALRDFIVNTQKERITLLEEKL